MSVVSSWLNNEWYAPLTFRIFIHGLTQYFLRRLRFLWINIHAATTVMKCNPQTAEIDLLSTPAILQTLIDGRSENIVSDFFQRPVSRAIYRLALHYNVVGSTNDKRRSCTEQMKTYLTAAG